jgi:hypothetical protein
MSSVSPPSTCCRCHVASPFKRCELYKFFPCATCLVQFAENELSSLLLIAALPPSSLTPLCLALCPGPARAATHWSRFRAHLSLLHAWSVLAPKETARPSLAKVEEIVAFLQPHLENVQGAPLQVR